VPAQTGSTTAVRAGRPQPGELLPLRSPEWLDPDPAPWAVKPREASKLTEAVVETSREAFMEASQSLFAKSISVKPLFAEPMTAEHVTAESMSPEPMSSTPRIPEPRACQE